MSKESIIDELRDLMENAFRHPTVIGSRLFFEQAEEERLRVEAFVAHPRRWRVSWSTAQLWHITNGEFMYCFGTEQEAINAERAANLRLLGGMIV